MKQLAVFIALAGLIVCACKRAPQADAQTPDPATSNSAAASAPVADTGPQFQLANEDGALVPVSEALVAGKVTVIDFYADWCAPCKALEKQLRAAISDEPRIAVRKIDVGAAEVADILEQYGVRNLPHIRIYDPEGTLLHDLPGTEAERTPDLALEAAASL